MTTTTKAPAAWITKYYMRRGGRIRFCEYQTKKLTTMHAHIRATYGGETMAVDQFADLCGIPCAYMSEQKIDDPAAKAKHLENREEYRKQREADVKARRAAKATA